MGKTHSTSSIVAFLACLPLLPHASAPEVVVATVCAAGAGILPDLDHQSGTASRSFGPISHAMCKTVATISGGHRHATHSALGIAVFTGIAWEASSNLWALGVLLWICMGFAVRSLHHRKHPKDHLIGLANAVLCAGIAYLLALHVSTTTSQPGDDHDHDLHRVQQRDHQWREIRLCHPQRREVQRNAVTVLNSEVVAAWHESCAPRRGSALLGI
jgi:hypothetical protein